MSDDFEERVRRLRRPGAFPEPTGVVELRRTHISEVLLTDRHAYKLKRPLDLGFLDFTTLERRRAACEAEVALNRRLAPGVYLDVVPVVETPDGPAFERPGTPVEWAVKMVRLPDEATLLSQLERGSLTEDTMRRVGAELGRFHLTAETSDAIAAYGRFEVVARNAVENFEQSRDQAGEAVHADVHTRLRAFTEAIVTALRPHLEARLPAGRIRDGHGDLRLEHVYLLDDRVLAVDCIEFADRFRYGDVISDVAFLYMDLAVRGERRLAQALVDAWAEATGDAGGLALLPFYSSYRSAVRGKVAGLTLSDPELDEATRERQLWRARRHWLFALGELLPPDEEPVLIGVGGLPGAGKTTLARALADRLDLQLVRSDVVRKERAGLAATASARAGFREGLYTDDARDAVYDACFADASERLFAGGRVIIDASFSHERWREQLAELGRRWGVPTVLLWCEADEAVVRERLAARTGDASDADVAVYERARAHAEPLGPGAAAYTVRVDTTGPVAEAVGHAAARVEQVVAAAFAEL